MTCGKYDTSCVTKTCLRKEGEKYEGWRVLADGLIGQLLRVSDTSAEKWEIYPHCHCVCAQADFYYPRHSMCHLPLSLLSFNFAFALHCRTSRQQAVVGLGHKKTLKLPLNLTQTESFVLPSIQPREHYWVDLIPTGGQPNIVGCGF